eukprot:gene4111-4505_t
MSWDLVNNELEELHAIFTATEMTESNNTIYHRHHYHHYHHHPSLPDEEEEEEEEEEVYVQRKEEVEDNNDLLPRAKTQDQTAVEEVIFQWQQANQVTPFYLACQCGKIEVVRVLLSQDGLEMDKPDKKGQTPFHIACSNGYEEIVKLLLLAAEDRVNINAVTLV